jgi:hypothetical protein
MVSEMGLVIKLLDGKGASERAAQAVLEELNFRSSDEVRDKGDFDE